ncbi:uncharacterized protein ATNIH1004_010704 [Aspergillus tanneri]|uniref:Uncharacterized protein n=1 Tax=Aspergillus tanneri TaxID=1220188 RepID=A0A5M9M452_9EURO|nr:uncharacterized protein ATNIH1004_010704 [Aspergillus tanneri]KAA8641765.1 hypothetical protein ATNIH1004_010704 [Aspergillus tanneri]
MEGLQHSVEPLNQGTEEAAHCEAKDSHSSNKNSSVGYQVVDNQGSASRCILYTRCSMDPWRNRSYSNVNFLQPDDPTSHKNFCGEPSLIHFWKNAVEKIHFPVPEVRRNIVCSRRLGGLAQVKHDFPAPF